QASLRNRKEPTKAATMDLSHCNADFEIRRPLSFRELETLARSFLSVLLTFLDARIASHQSCLFQSRAKVRVVFHQGARNSVTNGACLSRRAAAVYIDQDIELCNRLRQLQRLANNHAQGFVGEINLKCA